MEIFLLFSHNNDVDWSAVSRQFWEHGWSLVNQSLNVKKKNSNRWRISHKQTFYLPVCLPGMKLAMTFFLLLPPLSKGYKLVWYRCHNTSRNKACRWPCVSFYIGSSSSNNLVKPSWLDGTEFQAVILSKIQHTAMGLYEKCNISFTPFVF